MTILNNFSELQPGQNFYLKIKDEKLYTAFNNDGKIIVKKMDNNNNSQLYVYENKNIRSVQKGSVLTVENNNLENRNLIILEKQDINNNKYQKWEMVDNFIYILDKNSKKTNYVLDLYEKINLEGNKLIIFKKKSADYENQLFEIETVN